MSLRLPTVQSAMSALGRRMRVRRVKQQSIPATQKERPSSLFASPILNDIHTQITAAAAPSALETSQMESFDLASKLCSFLHPANATATATVLSAPGSSRTAVTPREDTLHNSIKEALLSYNPTLDSAILKRVACAVDVDATLRLAKNLVQAIRDGGNFGQLCLGLMKSQPTISDIHEKELQAGIAAKLHQGSNGRRTHRLSGFRLHTSDVQVAEVLPNGKVVTFVDSTLPGSAEINCCRSSGEAENYLHFVLYKEGLSLSEAFSLLSEMCGGDCPPENFSSNVALEESAVTVQVCSLYVPCHKTNSLCYKMHRENILKKLLRVNLRPLQLSLQVLGWRKFSCNPSNSQRCQMQYSMLIRGVTAPSSSRGRHLENRALAKLAAFPNFFGPCHFGMRSSFCSPFCFYHAAAALERNMPAEALVIAACLTQQNNVVTTVADSSWVSRMVELLCQGEDRSAVLKEWYWLHVPYGIKAQIASNTSALLWNVLASCRLSEMGEGAIDGVPEPGDFVRRNDADIYFEETVAKPELFPDACLKNINSGHGNYQNVQAVFTREEAASYALKDVVIPLNLPNNSIINQLLHYLGFTTSYPFYSSRNLYRNTDNSACCKWNFRPLFATGSGHPRAACPFVKALPEMCSVADVNKEDAVYKLLTDMELRQRGSYTVASRGQSSGLWPIGKYGHRLVDRLPAGALQLATPSTAPQHGTKCLALHFTLPAQTYSMAFFREFMVIEDHTTLSQRNNVERKSFLGVARAVKVTKEPEIGSGAFFSFDGLDIGNILNKQGD